MFPNRSTGPPKSPRPFPRRYRRQTPSCFTAAPAHPMCSTSTSTGTRSPTRPGTIPQRRCCSQNPSTWTETAQASTTPNGRESARSGTASPKTWRPSMSTSPPRNPQVSTAEPAVCCSPRTPTRPAFPCRHRAPAASPTSACSAGQTTTPTTLRPSSTTKTWGRTSRRLSRRLEVTSSATTWGSPTTGRIRVRATMRDTAPATSPGRRSWGSATP